MDKKKYLKQDFAELQSYIKDCEEMAQTARASRNDYGEDYWNDRASQAEMEFLRDYDIEWSDYDRLKQEYKQSQN